MEHTSLPRPSAMTLERGDIVVLLSDGFFEHQDPNGEFLGTEPVTSILSENRNRTAEEILAALRQRLEAFARGTPQDDDLTAIILKRHEN